MNPAQDQAPPVLELMTPERADSILKNQNSKNRSIRLRSVEKIAFDIIAGKWRVTHQPIAFSRDGELLDGQHRLSAIVKAKQPVRLYVKYGLDEECMDVIDTGICRTASDTLRLRFSAKSSSTAAAGIKHLFVYRRYPATVWTNIVKPSHSEISEYYAENQDIVNEATEVALVAHRRLRRLSKTAIATVFLLVHELNGNLDNYKKFIESLSKGTELPEDSPLAAYRNFLINSATREPYPQQSGIANLIQCFNYWNNGRKIKLFKKNKFPPMPKIETP